MTAVDDNSINRCSHSDDDLTFSVNDEFKDSESPLLPPLPLTSLKSMDKSPVISQSNILNSEGKRRPSDDLKDSPPKRHCNREQDHPYVLVIVTSFSNQATDYWIAPHKNVSAQAFRMLSCMNGPYYNNKQSISKLASTLQREFHKQDNVCKASTIPINMYDKYISTVTDVHTPVFNPHQDTKEDPTVPSLSLKTESRKSSPSRGNLTPTLCDNVPISSLSLVSSTSPIASSPTGHPTVSSFHLPSDGNVITSDSEPVNENTDELEAITVSNTRRNSSGTYYKHADPALSRRKSNSSKTSTVVSTDILSKIASPSTSKPLSMHAAIHKTKSLNNLPVPSSTSVSVTPSTANLSLSPSSSDAGVSSTLFNPAAVNSNISVVFTLFFP